MANMLNKFLTQVSSRILRASAMSIVLPARFIVVTLACCSLLASSTTAQRQSTTAQQQVAYASVSNAVAPSDVRKRNLAVFDEAWQTIGERYYDRNFQGVDWRAARREFRPLAATASDEQALYNVLRRMIAPLRDPHTRALPPTEQFDWRDLRQLSVGIGVREIAPLGYFVEQVADDSEALRQGARPGDEIVSVDGEQVRQRVVRLMDVAAFNASDPTNVVGRIPARSLLRDDAGMSKDRDVRALSLIFYGTRDTFADIVLRDPQGRVKTLRVRRELRPRVVNFSARRVAAANKTIGIVRFDLFKAAAVAQLARALAQDLRDVDGLVIDFRRNGGGELEAMVDAASMFLPPDTPLGDFTDRNGRTAISTRTRARLLTTTEDVPRYLRSVIILTSAQTASAAEVFAAALRDAGTSGDLSDTARNINIIGEHSCGCVLGVRRFHRLPDGGTLMVSELDFHTARRERLEQRGVSPAVSVTPTRADLIRRRDPAVERALTLLTTSLRPK